MGEAEVRVFGTLDECESVIRKYISSYDEAGQALLEISERELWREANFATFQEYVEARWKFTLSRASQLMSAGKFLRALAASTEVLPVPESERVIRPLMSINRLRDDQETWDKRVHAWRVVNDQAHAQRLSAGVSPAFVEAIVQHYFLGGSKAPSKPSSEPKLAHYEAAFTQIASCPLKPAQFVAKFGHPATWEDFYKALQWMEEATK